MHCTSCRLVRIVCFIGIVSFVAERGYVFEQEHAFFPLYPSLMAAIASPLRSLFDLFGLEVSLRPSLLLSGFIISNVAFILTAMMLYL
jgi:phosphatidylinositol glycan class V